MGEERQLSVPSSDYFKDLSLAHTISNRVEKKFLRTLSWCREHLGTRKPRPKHQGHNEVVEGEKPVHIIRVRTA